MAERECIKYFVSNNGFVRYNATHCEKGIYAMKSPIHVFIIVISISLALILGGCSSITTSTLDTNPSQTLDTKISFGGYYFDAPQSPSFIGASANDALVLVFRNRSEKAVFSINYYKNFDTYNMSADAFLAAVYGQVTSKNKSLIMLKQHVAENEISRSQTKFDNKVVYRITYQTKEYAVIYNDERPHFWVSIESTGVSTPTLLESLKDI